MAVEAPIPLNLEQLGPGSLGVTWDDGHRSVYDVRRLRLACRCAHCVDEWTHERRLRDSDVPADVRPVKIDSVGRYAFRIQWTDGHDTGIYPFASLRQLCECASCKPA